MNAKQAREAAALARRLNSDKYTPAYRNARRWIFLHAETGNLVCNPLSLGLMTEEEVNLLQEDGFKVVLCPDNSYEISW